MKKGRLQQLFQMLENRPNDSFLLFAVATEYKLQDKPENAIEIYRKLIASNPDYVGAYYHLGQCLESMEEQEEAIIVYRRGVQVAEKVGDSNSKRELMEALLLLLSEEEDG